MTRVSLAVRTGAAACLMIGLLSPPAEAASPTPSGSPWPQPGAGAKPATPVPIAGTSLTVRPLRDPLVLLDQDVEKTRERSFTLGTDVLFATGQATLTNTSTAALQALAARITDASLGGKAQVIGNTDDVGTPADNLDLSRRRADAVTQRLNQLLAGRGVSFTAIGRGESDPLMPNSNDAARARNRRVSVVFSGSTRVSPDSSEIALPSQQPAPAASTTGAPEGSLAGTERTLAIGQGENRKVWRLRLDVMSVRPIGQGMIEISTQTQVLSGPDQIFTDHRALFTGVRFGDGRKPVIYDSAVGQSLPPVIDGQGKQVASDSGESISQDTPATDWALYPRPSRSQNGTIALYIPAFGVLQVPFTG